jgi:tetratricopeptide (TPR) repeat protein
MRRFALGLLCFALASTAPAQEATPNPNANAPYDFILAKLAAEDGRFDQALGLMDKVIERNSNDPVLLYERAMILIDASRHDKAEAELRKLVAAHPDFYDAQRILGRLLFDRAGGDRAKMDEALSHLQLSFRLNPDDIGTGMAVSQILLSEDRTGDAEKVMATLLERAPDQRALNYNYAQVLTKLGRGDESRPYLERAVAIDPTFAPAILQLIDIYQKQDEWLKAAEILQPLITDDPLNLDLQKQQALFYLRAGRPEKARESFTAILAADPKDERSRFYMAEALSDLDQHGEADAIYRSLLEKTPNDPDLLASFGLSLITQRNYDEARKTFLALLSAPEVPDNLTVLGKTQLALIDYEQKRYAAAVARAREVLIFRDKPNGQAVNVAVESLKKEKKYAEALELLRPLAGRFGSDAFVGARVIELTGRTGDKQKALELAQTQAKFGVRNAITAAEAFVELEDFPDAITVVRTQSQAKPEDLDLLFELGSLYERSGDRPQAEKTFLSLLARSPEHAQTLNYLGYMWAEKGVKLDRAADMINRAVTQEPRNGAYVDSLGWVYYQQGKLDLAEKYLTDAARLLPRDATVREHLGDVFAKRGNTDKALETYREALSLEPQQKDEANLKSKIAELEKHAGRTR